jgi:hypothetical protein
MDGRVGPLGSDLLEQLENIVLIEREEVLG